MTKQVTRLTFFIAAATFLYLLGQCFALSQNFDLASWRGPDDMAFHISLRSYVPNIFHIGSNDYGYGYIFWITNAIFSMPGYLVHLLGNDALLIASPRILSLCMCFGGVWFFYKILQFYTKNQYLQSISVLFLLSFPAFGFLATYFGTSSHVFFYTLLTFYFLLCTDITDRKNQKRAVIALGACGAVKLTGLMIVPICLMIYFDKNYRANTLTWSRTLNLALIFLLTFVILVNPRLIFSIFHHKILFKYLDTMQFFLHQVNASMSTDSLSHRIMHGFVVNFLYPPVFALMILSWIIFSIAKIKTAPELIYMVIGYFLSAIVLLAIVNEGTNYFNTYFFCFSWMPLLGVLLFGSFTGGVLIIGAVLIANFILNFQRIYIADDDNNWLGYNIPSHIYKQALEDIAIQKQLQAVVKAYLPPLDHTPWYLITYQAPIVFNHYYKTNEIRVMFDISVFTGNEKFDYIVVTKKSNFYNAEVKNNMRQLNNQATEKFFANVKILDKLFKENVFLDQKCKQIFQSKMVYLFKCESSS